jgi:hypothetical protein
VVRLLLMLDLPATTPLKSKHSLSQSSAGTVYQVQCTVYQALVQD